MNSKETVEQLGKVTDSLQRLIDNTRVKTGLLKLEAREVFEDFSKGLLGAVDVST